MSGDGSHGPGPGPSAAAEPEASVHRHRREAPRRIPSAVVTVSDTRTPETDTGGALVADLLAGDGHPVVHREIVPDDVAAIRAGLRAALAALAALAADGEDGAGCVVLTGGTGVAPRDVTPEAVAPLLDRALPGFGELFRMLSWAEIGSAAMVSRALAGFAGGVAVFALPGSRGAIRTALQRLILPELGHLVGQSHGASPSPGRSRRSGPSGDAA